jgi:hypothetical protein
MAPGARFRHILDRTFAYTVLGLLARLNRREWMRIDASDPSKPHDAMDAWHRAIERLD